LADQKSGYPHRKRGRPPKFGRPSQLVAVTLPAEVVRGLRSVHPDLAWAIVALFEKGGGNGSGHPHQASELVGIGDRNSLIVVNRATVRRLPGIDIVPLAEDRAFLALEPGCGLADLETAVLDRLATTAAGTPERRALAHLRGRLRTWRRDRTLRFHTRAIIVVERLRSPRPTRAARSAHDARKESSLGGTRR
jgi:hypothetical protein